MRIPRGYDRLYNGRPAPAPPVGHNPLSRWGIQPAGQTVGEVATTASIPILLVGLVGFGVGLVGAWKFVRGKGWGAR